MLQYEPAVYPHNPHISQVYPQGLQFWSPKSSPRGGPGGARGPGLGHFSEVIDFDDVGRETLARWDLESEVEETQTQGFPSSASERLVKG